jgi:teichuronic acid exporter
VELPGPASARVSDATPAEQTLLHAVAWTGAGRWAVQLLTWASTIATARILAPSDYGLIGMATVYLGLVALISELGLGQAAITLRELSSKHIAQLNSLCIIAGASLFVLSCSASVALGKFFHSPKLPAVVAVMSVTFLVSGAQVIPDALLQGDLRFKLLAWFDTTRAIIQAFTTVGLATLGFGYWSLAFGPLAAAVAGAVMAVIARPHSLARPKWREIKHALRFGRDVLSSRVAWYTYSNSDFLVAGRVLGQVPLGTYTIAWTIASTPVEKITNMMTRVTPAFFAAAQKDKMRLRGYLLGITQALSLLTFPACIGLALVADEFVLLVLGPKWIPATVPLQLLAICAALRSITTVLPNMLLAIRDSRFVMWNTALAAVVFPPAFYVGSRWGTSGIAWAWIVMYPIITAPYIWRTLSAIDLRTRTYLGAFLPALQTSAIMMVAVVAARLATPQAFPVAVRFTIAVAAGIAAYAAALFFKERDRLRDVLTLIRGDGV